MTSATGSRPVWMGMRNHTILAPLVFVTLFITCPPAFGQPQGSAPPSLVIPRIAVPPDIEAFLSSEPAGAAEMARIDRFVQRWPADGEPEKMRTVAYLGYTADALHVVFQAFDPDPSALRAHLIRREEVFAVNDDEVEVRLDTYGDRQQSYYFVSNPLGVQLDAAWPEVSGRYDESFDLLWHSTGRLTDFGYVVHMAIPFKSLRFRPGDVQTWGIYVGRWIPRSGEWTFWPRISDRRQSFLSQMARLEGVRDVSRGRGLQVIPYASSRAFTAVDGRDAGGPRRVRDNADARAGIDAKLVRNALVIDVTANPDFSQVESDAPQLTTNQRFEVFFPEKRPFFAENAGFMQTPINLLFTRRIADPNVGAKLTGRAGAWTLGALVADDGAPGARVSEDDPLSGSRAWAGVARATRTLLGRSSAGALVTRRVFEGRASTVAAVDTRLRLGKTWTVDGQWAGSRFAAGHASPSLDGSAYFVSVDRTGRTMTSRTELAGRSPDFVSDLGFVPRVDVHELRQTLGYAAHPAAALSKWEPTMVLERTWSFDGTPLDRRARPGIAFSFKRATILGAFAELSRVTLRPGDAEGLATTTEFPTSTWGLNFSTSPQPAWSASVDFAAGAGINFAPAGGRAPGTGEQASLRLSLGLRPRTSLRIENTWLRQSLNSKTADRRVFTTSIFRTQWAWQFTREWSLRLIGQYEDIAADTTLTTTAGRRTFNGDVLLTRLINPWTAVYVGYNGNARNRRLADAGEIRHYVESQALVGDAWQVFAKWSFLLRW